MAEQPGGAGQPGGPGGSVAPVAAGEALRDPDCIFCRIVAGEVPARLVLETDLVVAFHDIDPKADVHVLVIPRNHRANIVEVATAAPQEAAALIAAADRVAAELAPQGHFRLLFSTGAAAGQTVFHAHGHVLAGSGPAMANWNG